jgi:catechol 2,3-dioxygenase-like lactoylglutathione lyase family enzyme
MLNSKDTIKTGARSIRPFIGAKDFQLSCNFYRDLGFEEVKLSPQMNLYTFGELGFYLQNAYVKDWIDNSMLFVEVQDVQAYLTTISLLHLTDKYPGVRLSAIQHFDWGSEFYLHDPSGILWHFGQFR